MENLYEELALSSKNNIGPEVTDPAAVMKAIDAVIQEWNVKMRIARFAAEATKRKKILSELKAKIQADSSVIKIHAKAYRDIAQKQQQEAEKAIREECNIFVNAAGEIPQDLLEKVAKKYAKSEEEILRILGAKVKQKRQFKYKDDGVRELPQADMNEMAPHLNTIQKRNLYDFLGVSPKASQAQIDAAIDTIYRQTQTTANKTDEVNARLALVNKARGIMQNADKRRQYDKALENAAFQPVRQTLLTMKQGNVGFIDAQRYKRLIEECTSAGIPVDKAEYLLYTEAEKLGMSIDDSASVEQMTACRFCGALNQGKANLCRSCGMPLKVQCPNCGRQTDSDEMTCTKCGFAISDMPKAKGHIGMAESAIAYGNADEAETNFRMAQRYWKTCPDLARIESAIRELTAKAQTEKQRIDELCNKKHYYAVLKSIQHMGSPASFAQQKSEAETAVKQAEALLEKAQQTMDANQKIDCYAQALSICADCKMAEDKMRLTPPAAPTGLTAAAAGKNIRLQWNRGTSNHIAFLIVRKENATPASPTDGEQIGSTGNAVFDDSKAKVGISYYYAVYAKCGDILSRTAATTTQASMVVDDIDKTILKVNVQETSIEFAYALPTGMTSIEIYRDDRLVKTYTGSTFVDSGLQTGHTYSYRFVAVYQDSDRRSHKANGITLQFTPKPKPTAVDLSLSDGEHQATLTWQQPKVGNVIIFYSPTRFKQNRNDIVTLDAFKAERINVAGNSCTVNKDFSGERFFIALTVQDNIGVASEQVSIVSIAKLSNARIERDEKVITASWTWADTEAVRVTYSFDGADCRTDDYTRQQRPQPSVRITAPSGVKTIEVSICSLVKAGDRMLTGTALTRTFSLQQVKVTFGSVSKAGGIFGFFGGNKFAATVSADGQIPCDLHLLIQEGFAPTNLTNYRTHAVVHPADLSGGSYKLEFTYDRVQKGKPVYFRLIAAKPEMRSQVKVVPETQELK